MKKLLAVGIIILFIGASVVPSTGMVEISNNGRSILYVGGSGPGNYSKIQDAIDNASEGDTIFVYNGTYNEQINVNKPFNFNPFFLRLLEQHPNLFPILRNLLGL